MALTNKEAVLAAFNFEIPDNLVEKAMIDRALSGKANYALSIKETVELTIADVCLLLVNAASESEGSNFSITYDPKKLMDLRATLLKKYGLEDELKAGSTIKARSIW
jgi:hypothetical protein